MKTDFKWKWELKELKENETKREKENYRKMRQREKERIKEWEECVRMQGRRQLWWAPGKKLLWAPLRWHNAPYGSLGSLRGQKESLEILWGASKTSKGVQRTF